MKVKDLVRLSKEVEGKGLIVQPWQDSFLPEAEEVRDECGHRVEPSLDEEEEE